MYMCQSSSHAAPAPTFSTSIGACGAQGCDLLTKDGVDHVLVIVLPSSLYPAFFLTLTLILFLFFSHSPMPQIEVDGDGAGQGERGPERRTWVRGTRLPHPTREAAAKCPPPAAQSFAVFPARKKKGKRALLNPLFPFVFFFPLFFFLFFSK